MVDVLKKLTLGLSVAVVFFLIIELILMAAGVKPLYKRKDPYVGFSGYSPLFVKHTPSKGKQVYKTAQNKLHWFNQQIFPARKEKGVTRIFCVGGSTTYGRPYNDRTSFSGWLRHFLPEVNPNKRWEVINAGGISYASYRVAKLMEELVDYEPDIFIVYTGHNEFLEKRTYGKLLETPEFIRNIGALASRMRLYSALYNTTTEQKTVMTAEVKAMLDESVGPNDYHRDDEMRSAVLAHFQTSLVRIAKIAARADAKVIFVTPASNIGNFSPFKTEPGSQLTASEIKKVETLRLTAITAVQDGNPAKALSLLEKALAIDARNPGLLYLHAQSLRTLGRLDAARKAFIQARDEDICPLRALSPFSSIIEDVAKKQNTGLVDFELFVTEHSPNGIPGSELFLDHVHPTIEGNRMLALEIIKVMTQEGIITPTNTWGESRITDLSNQLRSNLDEKAHAEALRNLSKVLGWAGRHDEALRLLNLSMEKTTENGRNYVLKATLLQRSGNYEDALVHYRNALRFSPGDATIHYDYGLVLSKLGHKAKACEHLETAIKMNPNLTGVHYDLGVVLESLGEFKKAESAYKKALKLDPIHVDAYNNLGVIYAMQGNIAAAYGQFLKAVEADPSHSNAAENLAQAKAVLKK